MPFDHVGCGAEVDGAMGEAGVADPVKGHVRGTDTGAIGIGNLAGCAFLGISRLRATRRTQQAPQVKIVAGCTSVMATFSIRKEIAWIRLERIQAEGAVFRSR